MCAFLSAHDLWRFLARVTERTHGCYQCTIEPQSGPAASLCSLFTTPVSPKPPAVHSRASHSDARLPLEALPPPRPARASNHLHVNTTRRCAILTLHAAQTCSCASASTGRHVASMMMNARFSGAQRNGCRWFPSSSGLSTAARVPLARQRVVVQAKKTDSADDQPGERDSSSVSLGRCLVCFLEAERAWKRPKF